MRPLNCAAPQSKNKPPNHEWLADPAAQYACAINKSFGNYGKITFELCQEKSALALK
jgi:hypothetical protein